MVKRSLDIQQTIFARQQYLHDANKCSIFVSKYLFVCCFSSLLNFFTHVEINVKGEFTHVKGERLYRPSYARRSWAVGVLLACHTYWDTVRLFIYMYDHLSASVCQWHYLYLFKQFKTVATGIRTPTKPPHARRTLQPTAPPVACISFSLYELSLTFCIKIEEGQDA